MVAFIALLNFSARYKKNKGEIKMKKITVLRLTLAIGGMVSCSKISGNPEEEFKAFAMETIKITETATEKLNNAANGKEAGDVIVQYADSMQQIAKKGEELQKKYKDFDMKSDEKFKNENEEMMKVVMEFSKAMMNAGMKYGESKEFMDAIQKIGNPAAKF